LQKPFAIPGIFTLLLLIITISCSVEKNTVTSRNFHNLTAHYNVYYNGYESYKKGVKKAGETFRNDYTQILPLFYYVDESVHSAVSSDMKRAIDKATKVITFHSITAKPKVKEGDQSPKQKAFYEKNEFNKWVDDSYLMMGKAYMYQGEFFLAIETFKHVISTFPDEDIRFLAMVWLARANIMIKELREAERLIIALDDEVDFPEDYLPDFYVTRADYYIRMENYPAAIENLNLFLELKPSKDEKIRYTYILAQLYEEAEDNDLAMESFKKVIRYNPPYEMAFNAKVSLAEVFESGSSSSDEIKKLLNKMLKDSKNIEYRDQIYFALGNIAFEEGDKEKAIEYYALSVSSSVRNNFQKGESALTLANIYYDEPDYMLSAAYYDSAVSMLDSDYPNYNVLSKRSRSLSNLVYNLNIYELEDSVQHLATLSEEERFAVIDGIIEKVKQDEAEARIAEQKAMQDMQYNAGYYNTGSTSRGNQQTQGGKWYFYNLNAKSFGQPEFRMKWGDRKLEDNWRRSNKQSISSLTEGSGMGSDTASSNGGSKLLDNKSREFYLANIPLTDSAMEVSNDKLEEALFNVGQIYKNDLLDYNEAIKSFEDLIRRYPDGNNTPTVYYYLYELFNSIQNYDRAEYYKAALNREYPESHYSKLLSNPNYINELEEAEAAVYKAYEKLYNAYKAKQYQVVIDSVEQALVEFEGDPLIPKFKYLSALSTGALDGKEAMKTALDSLIAQYPGTEESMQAKEIINYMYETFPVIKEADEAKEAEEIYIVNPEARHLFVIALDKTENINQVNFDLLNYNLDNFNQNNLTIDKVDFNPGTNLLIVRSFNDKSAAERYRDNIILNLETVLSNIPAANYHLFLITGENYDMLFKQKELNPYLIFYSKNYIEMESE